MQQPWLVVILLFLLIGANSVNNEGRGGPMSVLMLHSMFPSHYYPLISLGAELVSRGHKVSSFGVTIEGYEHLPKLIKSYGINYIEGTTLEKDIYKSYVQHTQGTNISGNMFSIVYDIVNGVFKERDYLDKLMKAVDVKLNKSNYDYIIGEQATMSLLYYMHKKWKTDNIMLVMFVLGLTPHYTIPWTYPMQFTPLSDDMSFFNRLINTAIYAPLQTIAVRIFMKALIPDSEYSPLSDPLLHIIYQPTLYTTVIGVERAISRFPTQHYVGPMILPNRPPISSDLQTWLETNEPHLPVIYVSTGTMAYLSSDIANIIVSLSDHYRLVWVKSDKLSNGNGLLINGTNRIYVTQWLEQCSLLRNPSIKLALFHCGVSSVHEAFYFGVPVLCLPQGGDQYSVGFRISSQGLGISIRPDELTIDKLHSSVAALLRNGTTYKNNLKRIKRLLREGGGARQAADLVELYASVGYDHALPSFIRGEWNSLQFYNIDVWIVLVGVVIGIMWGVWQVLLQLLILLRQKHKK